MLRITALLGAAGLALVLGACAASPGQTPGASAGVDVAAPAAPGFSALVASRSATVVDISTLRIGRDEGRDDIELEFAPENDFADRLAWPLPASVRLSEIRDLASGVILTSDGLILTSAHVIANVDEAQVRLDDGRRFSARVVGVDRRTDVGLLKIDAAGLPAAVIGDSSHLAPGDWVAAIGAPFGFHSSVTTGVVSATNRFIGGGGEVPFIQTDVAINPGSSGSPLFNGRGEVVAINSMIYSGSGGYMGLSFAVPINLAMRIVTQLRKDGVVQRAQLGADFQEITPALAQSFALPDVAGALVVRVNADSPAQAAGLLRGDIVRALDGVRIVHFSELLQQVSNRPAGAQTRLDVWRHGAKRTLWAILGHQAPIRTFARDDVERERSGALGLSLSEIPAALRHQLRIDGGLLVREATGAARSEGIRSGDLIVAINDTRLEGVDDFARALARMPPGQTIALLVMRDRRLAYVPVQLPAQRQRSQPLR